MLNLPLTEKLHLQSPSQKIVWFVLALLVVLLDQATKYWANTVLVYAEPVTFLPYFNFTLLYNEGAAFSLLADAGGWQRIVFTGIALLVSIFLVFWILCLHPDKKVETMGLSLVLGGAIGNLWDRIYLGYVVDFIDWFYVTQSNECLPFFYSIFSTQSCHWPAFNIADSAILLGAVCLMIDMLMNGKKE
ncbi:signal peptidase II [Candidatus Endobugula sertula]|uniref:Lipoprotein signal peptidase n=1 Tax=Candidatus Endobugula sertula TaxID=62101 RepID=A0A1D2QTL5_9GAMM|nr:signal peptidase II [Candidatus Endobugula sertula]